METVNFGNLNFTIARPGTKASTSSRPELVTTPTLNKFDLNPLASQKMGVEDGDYVTILINDAAANINEMYFLTHGLGDEGQSKLASVGKKAGPGRRQTFSYSGVYSKMLQGATEVVEMSAEGLAELGLMVKRVTAADNIAYSALKKVHFEVGDGVEVDLNGQDAVVYPLTNVKFVDYDPREGVEAGDAGDEE